MHCNIQRYEALQHGAKWGTATYSYMRHWNIKLYELPQHTAIWGNATYSYMRHCNIQLYEALQHTALWRTTVMRSLLLICTFIMLLFNSFTLLYICMEIVCILYWSLIDAVLLLDMHTLLRGSCGNNISWACLCVFRCGTAQWVLQPKQPQLGLPYFQDKVL